MQSPRWGNDGRRNCVHLWVPCAVFPDVVWDRDKGTATYMPEPGQRPAEFNYKICIRPDCRKVMT